MTRARENPPCRKSAEHYWVFGPYSIEEARGYLASGRLTSSDFAQFEGTSEWIPLVSVPGIRAAAPPPPLAPAQPTGLDIGPIARDVAIVWFLTAVGGFLVGLAVGKADGSSAGFALGVAASNLLLGTVGFVIVGCLAKGNRWRHLSYVAVGVWLVSVTNIMLGLASFAQWLFGAFFVALIAGVGGGLSFAFKRR